MSNNENILLKDRRAFTARQSIDSLINYARQQDEKILARQKRLQRARGIGVGFVFFIPFSYLLYSFTIGPWRNIYSTSVFTVPFEARQNVMREYFVPEMYLKEREVRKIELGLKDTQELRQLYAKKKE